jgi:hypothetical protein
MNKDKQREIEKKVESYKKTIYERKKKLLGKTIKKIKKRNIEF